MKRFMFAFCAFVGLFACSCSDMDESGKYTTPDALTDTSWACEQKMFGETYTATISFAPEPARRFTYVLRDPAGDIDNEFSGTYMYDPNSTVIMLSSDQGDNEITMTGTVNGNRMTFNKGEETTIFRRQ